MIFQQTWGSSRSSTSVCEATGLYFDVLNLFRENLWGQTTFHQSEYQSVSAGQLKKALTCAGCYVVFGRKI